MQDDCNHEWEAVDSQCDNEVYSTVRCKHCWVYGQLDERTEKVYYPIT